jgi:L-ascorbate metabolism protein UlaG (beta-lactamase superfamily)
MERGDFIKRLTLFVSAPLLLSINHRNTMRLDNEVRLLRHATLVIQIGGKKILIDPMLSGKGAMDPVGNCGNDIRIPMTNLPVLESEIEELLEEVDAVIVTHLHRDHWDVVAQKKIDKGKTIICQPTDKSKLNEQGFLATLSVEDQVEWHGLTISRTNGRHGTGEIGQLMGEVSGFVLDDGQQKVFVAGDTIWCEEVKAALQKYQPDFTILNAGGAQFLKGDPITMTPDDIIKVHEELPETNIIAVHMDTVNHCFVKRSDLQTTLAKSGIVSKVLIPLDGEKVML